MIIRFGTPKGISMTVHTNLYRAYYVCSLFLIVLLIQLPGTLEIGHGITNLPGDLLSTFYYLATSSIADIMHGTTEFLQGSGRVLIGSLRLVTALAQATVTFDGEAIINIAIHVATIGIRG